MKKKKDPLIGAIIRNARTFNNELAVGDPVAHPSEKTTLTVESIIGDMVQASHGNIKREWPLKKCFNPNKGWNILTVKK